MVSTLEPSTTHDAPATGVTRETPAVSPLSERDRTRAAARLQQPAPGRYLAEPDGDDFLAHVCRDWEAAAADVVHEDASVSRRHALIVRRDGRSELLDDRSLNGVHVNGQRVSEAPLRHGDEILLGRIAVRYVEVAG